MPRASTGSETKATSSSPARICWTKASLVPDATVTSARACCLRTCFSSFGKTSVVTIAEALPILKRPRSAPASSAISSIAASWSRRICRARCSNCSPASVSITRRGARINSLAPSSFSSCRICMLIAAWVTWTRFAPAVNVPSSAMAIKARSCRISIEVKLPTGYQRLTTATGCYQRRLL